MRYYLLAVLIILAGCAATPPPPAPIVKVVAPPPPKIVIPPDPTANLSQEVRQAIESHQTPTIKSGITTIFPYSPDVEWTVYCQPLRATEIRLNPDEWTDKDSVVLGDSVRWAIKIGTQAVMVEPLGTSADPQMMTNLVIHSNRRSYHLNLRLRSKSMTAISWYYPDDVRELQATREAAQRETAAQATTPTAIAPPTAAASSPQEVTSR
jgi:type IV secretion system protein TrbG